MTPISKLKLPQPCVECPFRFTTEGGCIVPDTGADVQHPFPERQFQPCHMQPEINCKGNIRNDILLANGHGNGDQVRLTRDIICKDDVRFSKTLQPIQKPLKQIKRELATLRKSDVQSESGS